MQKLWMEHKKKFIFFGICLLMFLVFRFLIVLMLPFLIASLLAVCLNPIVNFIHKKIRLGKAFLAFILLLLISAVIISVLCLFGYNIIAKLVFLWNQQDTYLVVINDKMRQCCCCVEKGLNLKDGVILGYITTGMDNLKVGFEDKWIPGLFSGSMSVFRLFGTVGAFWLITYVAVILLIKDWDKINNFVMQNAAALRLRKFTTGIINFIKVYILAQIKIMSAIALACFIGYSVSGVKNILGLSILTAFLDLLPFIGTGIVIVPMLLWKLVTADYLGAVFLLLTLISCIALREYLEPKLISSEIGISPILTLIGLYVGMRVFGFAGIFLGPVYILLVTLVFREIFSNS